MAEQTTTSTEALANVQTLDDIAGLLSGEDLVDKPEEEDIETDITDESDVTEPAEETDATEEDNSQEEDSVTWGSALGLDDKQVVVGEDGNLKAVRVKVDGKESEVALPDLVAGYQTAKYNTQKSQALSEEMKNFEQVKTVTVAQYTQKIEQLQKVNEHLYNEFMGEYNSIDWPRLRVENPAEYAAAIQDFRSREEKIKGLYSTLEQEKTAEQEKIAKENSDKLKDFVNQQVEKVLENNPGWRDEKVRKQELESMMNFVGEAYGFNREEFLSVQDPRLIELVKDAMKLRKGVEEGKKKLEKPLPKFQQSTGKKVKQTTKLDVLTKRAKEASGANKRTAQVDAIAELLSGI
jgi:hypothetical protein